MQGLLQLTKPTRFREKERILQNRQRQGPKFRKLQEAIWLTVIKKIFKFSPYLDPFSQENYLHKLSLSSVNYPIQKR